MKKKFREGYLIKYRAKDIKTKEWVYGQYIEVSESEGFIRRDDTGDIVEIDIDTLCLKTRRKDKNRNYIYDGDILMQKSEHSASVINLSISRWDNDYAYVADFIESQGYVVFSAGADKFEIEIIGNIFDDDFEKIRSGILAKKKLLEEIDAISKK